MQSQSNAIMRHLGRKYDMYGSNEREMQQVDELVDGIEAIKGKYLGYVPVMLARMLAFLHIILSHVRLSCHVIKREPTVFPGSYSDEQLQQQANSVCLVVGQHSC